MRKIFLEFWFAIGVAAFGWTSRVWAEEGTFEVMPPAPCAHPCQVQDASVSSFSLWAWGLGGLLFLLVLSFFLWLGRRRRQREDQLRPGANP